MDFKNIAQELAADDQHNYHQTYQQGVNEDLVRHISREKNEPKWVLEIRLKALEIYQSTPMPKWGPSLKDLQLEEISYYSVAKNDEMKTSWEDVDPSIKRVFEKLNIPESERAFLAGAGAQYDSEAVYHNLKTEWKEKGVIFEDFDEAIKKYPQIVKKYFGKCITPNYHKFSALHYAVFSGGTFLYIPEGVKITQPLQAYFRMNARNSGQFEHTLIIAEERSQAEYIEGCSAPKFDSNSLHAGGVEVFVGKNAQFRYSSVENWSTNTYNLNTKKAIIQENGQMEWIGGNLGSHKTMLYPCSVLLGNNSVAKHLGVTFANTKQNQDVGSKIIVLGKNCRGEIVSKSLSKNGGISTYRGLVDIKKSAEKSLIMVNCDALILDEKSIAKAIPTINCENNSSIINHEAKTGKISSEMIFYFQSRGINIDEAKGLIVNGFLDEVVKTLPMEYAMELNRLIELEMEGSIG
jgi:Fe-S cluster assembly protein SufB